MNTYNKTALQQLRSFLEEHRAVTDIFTHTSIAHPPGKFNIPVEKEDEFYNLYYQTVFTEKKKMYLTEKPNIESSPFRCDLDFRHFQSDLSRNYTTADLNKIMQAFMTQIQKWTSTLQTESGESSLSQRLCFVFEKESPRYKNDDDKGQEKRIVKDGVHLVFPFLVSSAYLQEIVRQDICESINLDSLNLKNSLQDVFDPHVIFRNNWQLYGSQKPNCSAYSLTSIFNVSTDSCEEVDINQFVEDNGGERMLIHRLKIRRPLNECIQIDDEKKDEYQKRMEHMVEYKKYSDLENKPVALSIDSTKVDEKELAHICKLVQILSPRRASSYKEWIELGWCLYNIHNTDDTLLNAWIEFSKTDDEYSEGAEDACQKEWNKVINGGLQMGTLLYWAKLDNLKAYNNIMCEYHSDDLSACIKDFTEYDIAKVMKKLYSKLYVCVSTKEKRWFHFDGIRWSISESGKHLKRNISTELYEYITQNYMKTSMAEVENNAVTFDQQCEQRLKIAEEFKEVQKQCKSLKKTSFKNCIMTECMEVFHDYAEEFCNKLDSNIDILGFENGVYELDTGIFRSGRAEDYLTMSTKIDYVEHTWNDDVVKEVMGFFAKLYVNENVREYVLMLLSTFMGGSVKEEKFPIWTGVGSNGKSKLIELLKGSTGEYFGILPVSLLTAKRADAGSANPHMAATRGKRILVMQEPDTFTQLNVGLMKEFSGGDPIVVRQLYEKPVEFKPQFHMVLICNDMPALPPEDQAVWRRVRVCQHKSRFVDHPDPKNPHEFLKDRTISERMKLWHEPFMWILLQYYKKYLLHGIHEPEEVMNYTLQYQMNQDHVATFVSERIAETKIREDIVTVAEIYDEYKYYVREYYPGVKAKNKIRLTETLTKKFGPFTTPANANSQQRGWTGYTLHTKFQLTMNDDSESSEASGECLIGSGQ